MKTEIAKGMIVKWDGKFGMVSKVTKTTVNLKGPWGGKVWAKQVPIEEVVPAGAEFYNKWTNSETYMCM
jgi:hypothetical protein